MMVVAESAAVLGSRGSLWFARLRRHGVRVACRLALPYVARWIAHPIDVCRCRAFAGKALA